MNLIFKFADHNSILVPLYYKIGVRSFLIIIHI